jgi:hypothetical protein
MQLVPLRRGSAGIALTLLQCEAALGWEDGQCWGAVVEEPGDAAGDGKAVGGAPATSRVRDLIAGLTASLFEDGNLPSSTTSNAGNKLVQWCHGAPVGLYKLNLVYP